MKQEDMSEDNQIAPKSSTQDSPSNQSKANDLDNFYVDDFKRFYQSDDFLSKLKKKALDGDLRSCRFRSLAWRLFLDCLPENPKEWLSNIRAMREEYATIKNKYDNNPYRESCKNFTENNPLSQDEQSSWNKFFQDNELKMTIDQDVVRTFPEIDFFQDKKVQEKLCNILFHFARENPRISYKQGMHELLAPILFIVHSDQQSVLQAKDLNLLQGSDEVESIDIVEILDHEYLEHDSYFMFRQIMETVEAWYSHETISFKMDSINFEPFSTSLEPSACSVLGIKLRLIYDRILKRYDKELYYHLHSMQIEPQVFGIRWLRLLFGREFSLQDLLVVWDAIFSDGISFSLCDYIFASMLIVIRKILLSSNYSQCMSHLMRYPTVPDTQYIIHLALHLRDPVNYAKPECYSKNVLPAEVAASPVHVLSLDGEKIHSHKTVVAHQDPPIIRAQEALEHKRLNRPKSLSLESVTVQAGNNRSKKFHEKPSKASTPHSKNGAIATPKEEIVASVSSIASSFSRLTSRKTPQEMRTLSKIREYDDNELDYCIELMTSQIDILQRTLSEEKLENGDIIFLALAKLKVSRDILKGTLKYNEFS